jgi:FAD/FMN-containing dehydrogenase
MHGSSKRSLLALLGASAAIGLAAAVIASGQARRRRRSVLSATRPLEACEALHATSVRRIGRQLAGRDGNTKVSLRKRSVSHQVPKAGDRRRFDPKIDIGELNRILHVDPLERICVAESGVTFVDLVAATLRYGLVPMVVPELKTITIGGAVSGCSIESSSFRYGGFHDTCLEYEVITAKGEALTCSPHNGNSLLFQMIHGSFGTLGILSKLVFRLMPAKRFVKVTYHKFQRLDAYLAALESFAASGDVDFIDGILHAPDELVLCVGRFVDQAPYANRYDWIAVYYRTTRERSEDYLETADYLFRYDTGVTNPTPKSTLGRLLFGKLLGSTMLLRLADKLHWILPAEAPPITLDVFVPFSKVPAFMDWYEKEFGHFPLWCVPYRRVRDYEWLNRGFYEGMRDELFVDIAIYGMKQLGGRNYHKLMEDKLLELGGVKTLISHNYYSEEDFWRTWNRSNYEKVKAITDPENLFRHLYAKTCKAAMGSPEALEPR